MAVARGVLAVLLLAACGTDALAPSPSPAPATPSATVAPSPPPGIGDVQPAPGSDSAVYAPNPGAIVVAIDPGHGGCLDWGVPDPLQRGEQLAEKTLVLAIAELVRERLLAEGIGVVMMREGDEALAGDLEPDFGCDGPEWRDVDGDGNSGFEETGRVRTRDELQARIDLANLTAADAFVSIHINSLTQNDVVFEIAATQTFYDDETPWGAHGSAPLADALQAEVVAALTPLADYDRQDRGTEAVAYYAISRTWDDADTCETPGDTWCKPHRGLLMPAVLTEVGSITLRQEHDLLASAAGQEAIADALFDGLAAWFAGRDLAVRLALVDAPAAATLEPIDGTGPPFWAPVVDDPVLRLRVTNTGMAPIPAGVELVAGWESTDQPYLALPPVELARIGPTVPALEPGESVVVSVGLPAWTKPRGVAWISLMEASGETFADHGSPALQFSSEAP